ncbi:hypothetical protein [Sphingobacterium suaedae]|uniref:Uncharacterized protein n=1 Tax=Sphingobacterium suaedae TaxID=1686402 RepID=A0ABW5KF47_9SPHI
MAPVSGERSGLTRGIPAVDSNGQGDLFGLNLNPNFDK